MRVLTMLCPSIEDVQQRIGQNTLNQTSLYLQFPTNQSGGDSLPVMPLRIKRLSDRLYRITGTDQHGWRAEGVYDTKNNSCTFMLFRPTTWVPAFPDLVA